jgi:hypothetical protein
MRPILDHVRNNLIAYLALFVALGGTRYAAATLPSGSVGTPQLRNGAIIASKLNRASIGGYVLAWAHVRQDGRVLSGSRGARAVFTGSTSSVNFYFVRWRGVKFSSRCTPLATLSQGGPRGASTVRASINNRAGKSPAEVGVVPSDPSGNSAAADFYVAVVC